MDDNQPIVTPPTPTNDPAGPAPMGGAGMPVAPPEPPMAPPVTPFPAPEPMPTPPPSMPQQMPGAPVDAVEPGSEVTPVADPPAVAEDVAPAGQMPPQN